MLRQESRFPAVAGAVLVWLFSGMLAAAAERELKVWLMYGNLPAQKAGQPGDSELLLAAERQRLLSVLQTKQQSLKWVRVLNLVHDANASLLVADPAIGVSPVELLVGQLPFLEELNRWGDKQQTTVKVRYLRWEQALFQLISMVPGALDTPDLVQLGSTWYSDLQHLGKLDCVPAAYASRLEHKLAVAMPPGRCAVPWFVDVRILYYWRVDSRGRPLPVESLDDHIRDWAVLDSAIRNWRGTTTAEGAQNMMYPLAIPVGRTYNLLHMFLLFTGVSDVLRGQVSTEGLLFLGRLARDKNMLVAFPQEDASQTADKFFARQYGMVIELPSFAAAMAGRWERGRPAAQGENGRKDLWTELGVAALPLTFRGGSYLAVVPNPSREVVQQRAAFALLEFLVESREASAMLPAAKGAQREYLALLPRPLQRVLPLAQEYSQEHPASPYWARAVETADSLDDLERFWQTISGGQTDEEVRAATVAMGASLRERIEKGASVEKAEHDAAFRRRVAWGAAAGLAVAMLAALLIVRRRHYRAEIEKERWQRIAVIMAQPCSYVLLTRVIEKLDDVDRAGTGHQLPLSTAPADQDLINQWRSEYRTLSATVAKYYDTLLEHEYAVQTELALRGRSSWPLQTIIERGWQLATYAIALNRGKPPADLPLRYVVDEGNVKISGRSLTLWPSSLVTVIQLWLYNLLKNDDADVRFFLQPHRGEDLFCLELSLEAPDDTCQMVSGYVGSRPAPTALAEALISSGEMVKAVYKTAATCEVRDGHTLFTIRLKRGWITGPGQNTGDRE